MVKGRLSFFALCLCTGTVLAASPAEPWHYRVDSQTEGNHLRYEAMQNNAPTVGEFHVFSGHVAFHPDALAKSYARLEIHPGSVAASYEDVTSTLNTAEWFDSVQFPTAYYETNHFTALGDGRYLAKGELQLKGQTHPVHVQFTLNAFSEEQANVTGEAVLKRTDYGIGWADTSSIADTVRIHFTLHATRLKPSDTTRISE